ncbi:MAG: DUF1549 domain-containing protein [Planctomycetaceae bacterium]
MRQLCRCGILSLVVSVTLNLSLAAGADAPSAQEAAQTVDRLLLDSTAAEFSPVDDSAWLRRACLDLVGRPPGVAEITAFGLDPDPDKRVQKVQELLNHPEYATNWSRYWRDAIFLRATNMRAPLVRTAFEEWMAENLAENRSWDSVVTDLLTATGPVNDNGATALIFAHEGQPEEIAAEASRLFLGIQIQCANCHNHPWDKWKREQFHEFVAFFPRVSVRRDRSSDNMQDYEIASVNVDRSRNNGVSQFLLTRIDRNRDQIISESEAKNTQLARIFSGQIKDTIDVNGDQKLSIQEILTARPPDANRPGQGAVEHHMPNLADPGSDGDLIHPAFFVGDAEVPKRLDDVSRRRTAADLITSETNPWFARAVVNRLWSELTSAAFYAPIDDLGPDRPAEHHEVLEVLSNGFTQNGYDLKWLITAITSTQFYQRPVDTKAEGFARLEPTRLRSDQFYNALCQTLNVTALPIPFTGRRGPYMRGADPGRKEFASTFEFDPSTPKSELTGSIPEALFLMNSPQIHSFVRADSANSTIARISQQVITDEDVVRELYLATVSREPWDSEVTICLDHVKGAASRSEGFEDLLWSLLNSSEYQSRQ